MKKILKALDVTTLHKRSVNNAQPKEDDETYTNLNSLLMNTQPPPTHAGADGPPLVQATAPADCGHEAA